MIPFSGEFSTFERLRVLLDEQGSDHTVLPHSTWQTLAFTDHDINEVRKAAERVFGIAISTEAWATVVTIQQAVDLINGLISAKTTKE